MKLQTVLAATIAMICSSAAIEANFGALVVDPSNSILQPTYLLADTNAKNRRENRQDDRGRSDDREERRDCRDEEGLTGKDKRDCKQEARQGENDEQEGPEEVSEEDKGRR